MFERVSLDKFRPQTFETREIGTVIGVKKAIASITGLPFCLYGQMVHFPNDLAGMVVGFNEEKVMALVLGDETQLKSGDEVIGMELGLVAKHQGHHLLLVEADDHA